jgi:glycine oxidase
MLSIPLWQRWALELAEHDIDIDFQQTGSVVVAHNADEGDFQLFLKNLQKEIQQTDIDANHVSVLNNAELRAIEPSLAKVFQQACFLKPEGSLDNVALLEGLMKIIDASDVVQNEQSLPDVLDGEFLSAYDKVVDCRGFFAKKQWAQCDSSSLSDAATTLRGVRGEVIRVHAPDVAITRPVRLMHPRYQLYIAPKPCQQFVIGATQIESESEHAITARSSLELLSALYSVDTGFAEAEVLETHARCRPALLDNLPAIMQNNNLYCVNGLYRHGYLLSPVVIEQLLHVLDFDGQTLWPELIHGDSHANA